LMIGKGEGFSHGRSGRRRGDDGRGSRHGTAVIEQANKGLDGYVLLICGYRTNTAVTSKLTI
jgi:hypothetical protein